MKDLKIICIIIFSGFILSGCGGSGAGSANPATPTLAPTPASVVTSFSINGSTGIINGGRIDISVPFGTNVTALVASFTTAPGYVLFVGTTPQVSGVTPNDFTQPVTYRAISTAIANNKGMANPTDSNSDITYIVAVTVSLSSDNSITSFSLSDGTNSRIGIITGTNISITMPFGTNPTALVATFAVTGSSVRVGDTVQQSGITVNDFTNPIAYTVTAFDGSQQIYMVRVTVALNSAKSVLIFSLTDGTHNGTGVIDQSNQTITVVMPFGTPDLTQLVATFAITGDSVKVGDTIQQSGATVNNFTNSVSYVVTAADESTAAYTVTVTIATSSDKSIIAFSLVQVSSINSGTGVITGQNIAVTMPPLTDTTSLIATFTITGASININGTTQQNGITINSFTSPVIYTIVAADGSTTTYTVTVTVEINTAKAITAFALNGTSGTINGQNISVNVPFGTNTTNLIATFTTTGENVSVNGVTQVSGTTSVDFTTAGGGYSTSSGVISYIPVTYTVTAQDSTTQNYTVGADGSPIPFAFMNGTTGGGSYGTIGVPSILNIPGPRHSGVAWTDTSGNFWLFGGENVSGSGGFFNDLWRYNPSTTEWTWIDGPNTVNGVGFYGTQNLFSTNNIPGSRHHGVSWVRDFDNSFWLFGGLGHAASTSGYLNDLWQYNQDPDFPAWKWVSGSNTPNNKGIYGTQGVANINNTPGGREGSVTWARNGSLYLFGGYGYDSAGGSVGYLSDLWRFDPGAGSNGLWTWISGSNLINQPGSYSSFPSGYYPGARRGSVAWTDSSGNLWLFGGFGISTGYETPLVNNPEYLNDLWKFNPSNGTWTFMAPTTFSGGTLVSILNQITGIYNTLGITIPTSIVFPATPGGRMDSMSWVDRSGNFWLLGGFGYGYGTSSSAGYLDDLWQFNPSTRLWTWGNGANTINDRGTNTNHVAQTPCLTGCTPGGRSGVVSSSVDASGNVWFFGGYGYSPANPAGPLMDFAELWKVTY
jgi:hypothetical protein